MSGAPILLITGQRPDRRIFMDGGAAAYGSEIAVTLASGDVDAGSPDRQTILRPGNLLLRDTATGKWFGDTASGDPSTQASVASLIAGGATWNGKTVTLALNGVTIVTVILGNGGATSAFVTDLNGNATFAANFIASGADGNPLVIKTLRVGSEVNLLVTSNLATAFGASGTAAFGTDGDWAVLVDWQDMFNGLSVASDQHGVQLVRNGYFDDDNLVWAGAAGLANLHQDAVRVLRKRGCKFKTLEK